MGLQRGTVLYGSGRELLAIPESSFREAVRGLPTRMGKRRAFMTDRHVRVREYVVQEMRENVELTASRISTALDLPVSLVGEVLADLERNLFFLVRNENGAVTWAFPVTIEPTAHRLTFSQGERIYGA